jgi:hypothetical protein
MAKQVDLFPALAVFLAIGCIHSVSLSSKSTVTNLSRNHIRSLKNCLKI